MRGGMWRSGGGLLGVGRDSLSTLGKRRLFVRLKWRSGSIRHVVGVRIGEAGMP